MPFFCRALATIVFALVAGLASAADPVPGGRAAWMREARWGVMVHYLADWRAQEDGGEMTVERWNALIDAFDVEGLAGQLETAGAGWFVLTLGQNSGYYLAPNSTYDRLTGAGVSKCARRDLVSDLQAALGRRGIRLVLYLPSGAPARDAAAQRALRWQNGPFRNAEFQRNWESVIRDWSERFGPKVAGWWFDGCYFPNAMYRGEAPNFATFAAAARAGNPDAAIAFNRGVLYRPISVTPEEDYTAGEVDDPGAWRPRRVVDGMVDGAQAHVLSYLGRTWGKGEPRYPTEQVLTHTRKATDSGTVVTWDVPARPDGTIPEAFLTQLRAMNAGLGPRKVDERNPTASAGGTR